MKDNINFAAFMETVARALLGEPNRSLSSRHEWRYGTNGSLSVNLETGTWFDHEANEGGGVIGMIKRWKGLEGSDALQYLRDIGCPVGNANGTQAANDIPYDANDDPFAGGVTLKNNSKQFHIVKTWIYVDETGAELFEVCRLENGDIGADGKVCKNYRQRHKGADGRYIDNIKGIRRVPYKLPKLVEAVANNKLIFITEGEKCVDSIIALGGAATCNPMGAGYWTDELTSFFDGADIIVIPDNDKPGADHANLVVAKLQGTARRARILELPGLPPKGDVAD
jgi:putative DNA primase/helicase